MTREEAIKNLELLRQLIHPLCDGAFALAIEALSDGSPSTVCDHPIRQDGSESSRGLLEGWVMVPREPTHAMHYAGCKVYANHIDGGPLKIYRAMIAAVPEPPK